MTTLHSAMSGWVADLEDDVAGTDSTKVYVAAVAVIGVAFTGATALGDVTRKVFPRAGCAQREDTVRKRSYLLAAPVAKVIGVELPKPVPARGLRSRWFYFLVGSLALAFSLEEGIGGTFNFLRKGGFRILGLGRFHHNIPIYALTMMLSVSAFAIAVVCAIAMFARRRTPRFSAYVIERSPLGAYRP
jgi:hypothetical protein